MSVFESEFQVDVVDPTGKKFDKVSRLVCSEVLTDGSQHAGGATMVLDIASQLYKLVAGEQFRFALMTTIHTDRVTPMPNEFDKPDEHGNVIPTVLNQWAYVMHGRVFKVQQAGSDKMEVYASYGGLLMALTGTPEQLKNIHLDSRMYLAIKKPGDQLEH